MRAANPAIRQFYAARRFRPLWTQGGRVRQEAWDLVGLASGADQDGLDPRRYGLRALRTALTAARSGAPDKLAHAEAEASRVYVSYLADLRGAGRGRLSFIDPALKALPTDPGRILSDAAAAPSLRDHLLASHRLNPLYVGLRRGLADYRRTWGALPAVPVSPGPTLSFGDEGARVERLRSRLGLTAGGPFDQALAEKVRAFQAAHGLAATGAADARTVAALNAGPAPYERVIRANLDRVRALPPPPGRRFILVNAADAKLWFYDAGRIEGPMKVIVGKQESKTPQMVGLIRFALVDPYWNVPEDLVQTSIAPKVLSRGVGYFHDARFEALSDWSEGATALSPQAIDWRGVAARRASLRVRQLPGAGNMMGGVKFMLPNELGIYLHDTPYMALFDEPVRALSNGCVRLSDAGRVGRWLFGPGFSPGRGDGPERRLDLAQPAPVYLTYLTAMPVQGGVSFTTDLYGQDASLWRKADQAQG